MIRTTLKSTKVNDPVTAFQMERELKEIKNLLSALPIVVGTGAPEGAVSAKIGSIYMRLDGGSSTSLYVKESGTGATGWVAK